MKKPQLRHCSCLLLAAAVACSTAGCSRPEGQAGGNPAPEFNKNWTQHQQQAKLKREQATD